MRELYGGVSEQAKSGRHRLEDAAVLLSADRWRGSMYMAGYAVECLLKATLMKRAGVQNLTDLEKILRRKRLVSRDATVFTHHLENLLTWSGGFARLQRNAKAMKCFRIVNRWTPSWRYMSNPGNREESQEFLEAVRRMIEWIENNV